MTRPAVGVAVPVNGTESGEPAALLATSSVAGREPGPETGWKRTFTEQNAPGASVAPVHRSPAAGIT